MPRVFSATATAASSTGGVLARVLPHDERNSAAFRRNLAAAGNAVRGGRHDARLGFYREGSHQAPPGPSPPAGRVNREEVIEAEAGAKRSPVAAETGAGAKKEKKAKKEGEEPKPKKEKKAKTTEEETREKKAKKEAKKARKAEAMAGQEREGGDEAGNSKRGEAKTDVPWEGEEDSQRATKIQDAVFDAVSIASFSSCYSSDFDEDGIPKDKIDWKNSTGKNSTGRSLSNGVSVPRLDLVNLPTENMAANDGDGDADLDGTGSLDVGDGAGWNGECNAGDGDEGGAKPGHTQQFLETDEEGNNYFLIEDVGVNQYYVMIDPNGQQYYAQEDPENPGSVVYVPVDMGEEGAPAQAPDGGTERDAEMPASREIEPGTPGDSAPGAAGRAVEEEGRDNSGEFEANDGNVDGNELLNHGGLILEDRMAVVSTNLQMWRTTSAAAAEARWGSQDARSPSSPTRRRTRGAEDASDSSPGEASASPEGDPASRKASRRGTQQRKSRTNKNDSPNTSNSPSKSKAGSPGGGNNNYNGRTTNRKSVSPPNRVQNDGNNLSEKSASPKEKEKQTEKDSGAGATRRRGHSGGMSIDLGGFFDQDDGGSRQHSPQHANHPGAASRQLDACEREGHGEHQKNQSGNENGHNHTEANRNDEESDDRQNGNARDAAGKQAAKEGKSGVSKEKHAERSNKKSPAEETLPEARAPEALPDE
eukprot:gene330-264_t